MLTEVVRVHRRGRNPDRDSLPEVAVMDIDGKLYVRHNRRWWMLSNGTAGWHSLNVGISDPVIVSRLNAHPLQRIGSLEFPVQI